MVIHVHVCRSAQYYWLHVYVHCTCMYMYMYVIDIQDLERRLQQAEQACQASQSTADRLSSLLQAIVTGVCEAGEKCARVKSCVDGCMSRLANYELRVGVVTRRVASLRGKMYMYMYMLYVHGYTYKV